MSINFCVLRHCATDGIVSPEYLPANRPNAIKTVIDIESVYSEPRDGKQSNQCLRVTTALILLLQ